MTNSSSVELLGRVKSVNVGMPQVLQAAGADGVVHDVATGIFKSPVSTPVMARVGGLEGDGQADTRVFDGRQVHGGALKAVYLYPFEHYATWSAELDRELPFGQFGENVTAEGILEDAIRIGDRLRIGGATLEVTEPRGPCYKLDIRMRLPEFRHRMRESGRTGFYARVVDEGAISAGDTIERIATDPSAMTVLDMHRAQG